MKGFDILNSITENKDNLFRGEGSLPESEYNAYFINLGLSQHMDTVLYANDMNLYWETPPRAQYEYFLNSIRVRPRRGKWAKSVEDPFVEKVCSFYGVGKKEGAAYTKILTPEQKRVIESHFNTGGKSPIS